MHARSCQVDRPGLTTPQQQIWHDALMDALSLTELQRLIARHGRSDAEPLRDLPHVRLMTAVAPTQPFTHVCEPTFALVARGIKRVGLNRTIFECAAGKYLIIPVDLPMDAHVVEATAQSPFLSFGLQMDPDAIATLLLETGTVVAQRNDVAGITVSDLTDDLIDAVVRLLRLLDRPADIPVLAPAIEREILWRLINGQQGAMVRQIGLANSRLAQISRAIRWIRAHYAETIRVEQLANTAGMSLTSFHRHFRIITSMTPIQYQKQIRLQAARSRLVSAAEDVAQVGFNVGYDSPSQFSRDYRRLFGRPPGEDGKRLRQSGERDSAVA